MKIGIDAIGLTIPIPAGTRYYAEQLLSSLAKIDSNNEYVLFSKIPVGFPDQDNFSLKIIPSIIPIFKRLYFLTYFAKKEGIDVFHFLDPYGSIFSNRVKIVTTVHDIDLDKIYQRNNLSEVFIKKQRKFVRKYTLSNSQAIIAVSDFTKTETEKYLVNNGLDKKVFVIHEAQSRRFRVESKHLTRKDNYFLCMGDFSFRKNVPMVIKAFAKLPKSIKMLYNLKIVISDPNPGEDFKKNIRKFDLEDSVSIIESPRLSELVSLYNQAEAFFYPSLYEGFGLPILEAMACGCPVITSNYGAMMEVAGGNACLVDPNSVEDLVRAMVKIVSNSSYAKKLSELGLKRAVHFSWEKTARKTLVVYEKVYKEEQN